MDIGEVRLRVRNENVRAKKCYEKIGFSAVNEVKKDNGVIATEMKIDKKIYRNFVEKRCLDAIQHKELRKQGVSISQIATIYKVNRETVSSFIKTI